MEEEVSVFCEISGGLSLSARHWVGRGVDSLVLMRVVLIA